jgi:nucleoside-diphosphate-sugar epimerase
LARALIVGCGCRGQRLGMRLAGAGWQVRGTTRDPGAAHDILAAQLEAVLADPERPASILDQVGDATLVFWLLGSALGEPELIAAIHGPRLERLIEKLVDTPVRGFVYEGAGQVQRHHLERGAGIVRDAAKRWRIPIEVVTEDPDEWETWTEAMLAAAERLTAGRSQLGGCDSTGSETRRTR